MNNKKPGVSNRVSRNKKIVAKKIAKKKDNKVLLKIIALLVFGFILVIGLGIAIVYTKIIKELPDVAELETMDFRNSSTIYDRKGQKLYTISGDGRRTYVTYNQISEDMINAIIAGEDKRFWENSGVDMIGLSRSFIYGVTGKEGGFTGTSTLTQQLIRNTIIANRSSNESTFDKLERKIKEYYLSYMLTNQTPKEKIIELYLNQISLGGNSYGVEQASLTYFKKTSAELGVLESSILASLPKGPTFYSPYSHYDRLMGYLYKYPKDEPLDTISLIKKEELQENKEIYDTFINFIDSLIGERLGDNGMRICGINSKNLKNRQATSKDGCLIIDYANLLPFLNNLIFDTNDGSKFEFQTGRKDYILGRMLEDGYISFNQYKKAIIDSIGFEFEQYIDDIKYPHFVMYIINLIEEKYGEDMLKNGGLEIYTTLDPNLQNKAQEIIKKRVEENKKFDADNAALLSIDNTNGDILAFVGGVDYFNDEIHGKVDMITSKRQPGSSFKPLVYALAIDKNEIGPTTPVWDIATTFPGNYEPKNYEGKFTGKIDISRALNGSRNIPAVKMYFLAGEQTGILDYLSDKVGFTSLDRDFYYGAPIALGSGEVTMMEMVKGYSVFANMGKNIDINPILKIKDSKGITIEEKTIPKPEVVLNPPTAYIMNSIMKDTTTRPTQFWNTNLTLNDRVVAAKTGTSNKLFINNGKKEYFPGDIWTIGYTPQITTRVWAGNTNGKPLAASREGISGVAPAWKEFMDFAHQGLEKKDWIEPEGVKHARISKTSGLLATSAMPASMTTMGIFTNAPTKTDDSLRQIEIDAFCNGKVGADTPPSAIKTGFYVQYKAINPRWQDNINAWARTSGYGEFAGVANIITSYSNNYCLRSPELIANANIQIGSTIQDGTNFIAGSNYVEIGYKGNNAIQKLQILLNNQIIQDINLNGQNSGTYAGSIIIPAGYSGNHKLTLRVLDALYVSKDIDYYINIGGVDNTPPEINLQNISGNTITMNSGMGYILSGSIVDQSSIRSINVYIDSRAVVIGSTNRNLSIDINPNRDLGPGSYNLRVEAIDQSFNKSTKNINLIVN